MADGNMRSFALLLHDLEGGKVLGDLSDNQTELIQKMHRHAEALGGAEGEITLKLKFKSDKKTVRVTAEITRKDPKPIREEGTFWFTKEGSAISNSDPRQTKLALREVPPAPPVRDTAEPPAQPQNA